MSTQSPWLKADRRDLLRRAVAQRRAAVAAGGPHRLNVSGRTLTRRQPSPRRRRRVEGHDLKVALTGQEAATAKLDAVKTGQPADYTKCDEKIIDKFGSAETAYGVACPTTGDVADIQSQATADTDFPLSPSRFLACASSTTATGR